MELHLSLPQLIGDELRVASRGLNEGGNQLFIGGGTRHDAAALNLFLQLQGAVGRFLTPRLGFTVLALRGLGVPGFVRIGGGGSTIPQARKLVDGPLLVLEVNGDAVHSGAILPRVRGGVPVGSAHTAGLADEPQQSRGHVVDGRIIALAGVHQIAGDVGGVLAVIQGKTHPEGDVPGEPGQLFVATLKRGVRHLTGF